jgi:uncharacterized protein
MCDTERREIVSAFDPRRLELILLPTEQCNFRCAYCYEDFEIGRMSDQVVHGVKNLIGKRVPELKHLRIQWFGGEPLAAKDICLDISKHAYKLSEKHGVEFEGWLTTNGSLLTPSLLGKLVALKQREFQITLDGDKDAHDTTRIRANGSGTFDRIWNNLVQAHKTDYAFKINLRLHVTRSNLTSMERLAARINSTFGKDRRFMALFHNIENLGGPHADVLDTLTAEEYDKRVERLKPLVKMENENGVERHTANHHACYAAKGNSFVIRATGGVNKCTVMLSDPRNDVGRIMEDGRIVLDAAKVKPWMDGFKTRDWETLHCPMGSVSKQPIEQKIDVSRLRRTHL